MKTKNLFIFTALLLFSQLSFSQFKVETNGKASVGTAHSSDNGRLKIGNDGISDGLSFYNTSAGGTDARIFRSSDILYFTRGTDQNHGIRINNSGHVAMGVTPTQGNNFFDGQLSVLTGDNISALVTRTTHSFDGGTAIKSMVARPLTLALSVNYNNSTTFHVLGNGEVYSSTGYITSDISLKSNIAEISNPLDKVMQLRGVTYDMNFPAIDESETSKDNLTVEQQFEMAKLHIPGLTMEAYKQWQTENSRKQMGVIAQEVEKVIPEVIRTRIDGLKAVSYSSMVGLLIEAMKEQQNEIEKLKLEIASIKGESANFRSSTGISELVQQCVLTQNAPNPFTNQTEIKYFVANGIKDAYICIFDMQGKMLQKINVAVGQNSIMIQGSTLKAGIYLYSLVADGQEVDTKRMILTR
jgi:hypothetical protein